MSKEDVKTPVKTPVQTKTNGNGATKETPKIKTPVVKKSVDELKTTPQGSVIFVARTAMALANTKERAGLNGTFKNSSVFSTKMNSALKTGGRIESFQETDPQFIELKALARNAVGEMKTASPYGDNTKAFLNFILANCCGTKGSRGFNASLLEGLKLD